jgi:5-methylthioadenosine/S-adenosylhomocysteine deaminase
MSQNVDLILTNAIVLTMDEQLSQYEPGAVAINGDSIVEAGFDVDIGKKYTSTETIDCKGKVLMPGLINAHTHVPMTLLRGLADDLRLDVWLLGYMMPVEREFVSPEFVHLGTLLACAELIRSGVTCFADMYYFEEHIAQATSQAGMRAICSQTVLKYPAPDAGDYEESLEEANQFIQRWKGHSLITPSIAPHAPYSCTKDILRTAAAMAIENDVPLHTHIAETAQEVENSRNDNGMPVIPYVKKLNILDAKVIAAHCVHVDEGEIFTLLHHKTGVVHNPSSNLKLASGFAPVTKMLETGLNVGIGTDGAASNNDLDMFEEIRLAALVAKGCTGDPTSLPAQTALTMATRLGSQALHMGHITGTIEQGKRADLILVDIDRIHNAPRFNRDPYNIYAKLVYAGQSTDVTDTMVNGKWLMRDRQLTTLDEVDLLKRAEEYARKIDIFLIEREQSVLSKLIAIGGATEVESFEVQAKVHIDDPEPILTTIEQTGLEILHHRQYHEFDTYFSFDDPGQGHLRYREDEYIDPQGEVSNVRYRLTHIGPTREYSFPSDVLLSRSRFIAPATHSLRFYREYFKPTGEKVIIKDRLRWRVLYHGTELYINLDSLENPELGHFLEVKSRTWSRRDAEHKAIVTSDLIEFLLGSSSTITVSRDYIEMIE